MLGDGRRRQRVLDEPPQRDGGLERRRLGHETERLLGHRARLRPAGRRACEHEPVDAVGISQSELLRDHAAEARAYDVRPVDAGLVEHLDRIAGHLGCRVRAGRRSRSRRCRGCRKDAREPLGEAGQPGSHPQRA